MPRAAPAAAFAVLLVVLLAGCGGAVTADGEGTPTRTVTPAPLPPETETPRGPTVLAPGVSDEGVFDANRLAGAHAEALSGTSFTAVREERRRYANGSLRSAYRSVVRMAADGERFRYRLNQTDVRDGSVTDRALARYSDGSVVYVASTRRGERTYSVLGGPKRPTDPARVFPENATARTGIARLFGTLPFDVVDRRTVDGRTVYRLTVENGTQDLDWLRSVGMNATVREDGLVSSYRLAYDVEGVRVTVAVDFRRVGRTEVTPPAWLPAARNATGTGSAATVAVRTGGATANGTARSAAPPTGGADVLARTDAGTPIAVRTGSGFSPRSPRAP